MLVTAYIALLVASQAWAGVHTGSSNLYFDDVGIAVLGLVLACAATALSAVVGMDLTRWRRPAFIATGAVFFLVPSLTNAAFAVLPENLGVFEAVANGVLSVTLALVVIAGLVYPFIIAAILVRDLVPARVRIDNLPGTSAPGRSDTGSADARAGTTAASGTPTHTEAVAAIPLPPRSRSLLITEAFCCVAVILVTVLAVVATMFNVWTEFVPEGIMWSNPSLIAAIATGVCIIAIVLLLRIGTFFEVAEGLSIAVSVIAFLALSVGMILCTLSTAQAVYSDVSGIGGGLVWFALVAWFPVLAVVAGLAGLAAVISGQPRPLALVE